MPTPSGEVNVGLSYLPVKHTLACGKQTTLRFARLDDVTRMRELLTSAVARGEGFSASELPPLDVACELVKDDDRSATLVLADSSGTIRIQPQWLCLSARPPLADAFIVVAQEARGYGVGLRMMQLYFRLAVDMGYGGCATDVFLNNSAMWHVMRKLSMLPVGCVPKSGYVNGAGEIDAFVFYKDLSSEMLINIDGSNTSNTRLNFAFGHPKL